MNPVHVSGILLAFLSLTGHGSNYNGPPTGYMTKIVYLGANASWAGPTAKLLVDLTSSFTWLADNSTVDGVGQPVFSDEYNVNITAIPGVAVRGVDFFAVCYHPDLNENAGCVAGRVVQMGLADDLSTVVTRSVGVAFGINGSNPAAYQGHVATGILGMNRANGSELYNADALNHFNATGICFQSKCHFNDSGEGFGCNTLINPGPPNITSLCPRNSVTVAVEDNLESYWQLRLQGYRLGDLANSTSPFSAILSTTTSYLVAPSADFVKIALALNASVDSDGRVIVSCHWRTTAPPLTVILSSDGNAVNIWPTFYTARDRNQSVCTLRIRPAVVLEDRWVLGSAFLDQVGVCLDFQNNTLTFYDG